MPDVRQQRKRSLYYRLADGLSDIWNSATGREDRYRYAYRTNPATGKREKRDKTLGPGPGFQKSFKEKKRDLGYNSDGRMDGAANNQRLAKRQTDLAGSVIGSITSTDSGISTATGTASAASPTGTSGSNLDELWVIDDVYQGRGFFE